MTTDWKYGAMVFRYWGWEAWLPPTFHSMLVWRMQYDRRPLLKTLENKLTGREYAEANGVPVPELYWSGTDVENIPFDDLPASYVLKAAHLSGAVIIVKNGVLGHVLCEAVCIA